MVLDGEVEWREKKTIKEMQNSIWEAMTLDKICMWTLGQNYGRGSNSSIR